MPEPVDWPEDALAELLDLVRGRGKFMILGGFMHTYPTSPDAHQAKLYAGCCELERRGLIRRHIDESDHVCFCDAAHT